MSLFEMLLGGLFRGKKMKSYREDSGVGNNEDYIEKEQKIIENEVEVIRVYPSGGFTWQSSSITFLIILTLLFFLEPNYHK